TFRPADCAQEGERSAGYAGRQAGCHQAVGSRRTQRPHPPQHGSPSEEQSEQGNRVKDFRRSSAVTMKGPPSLTAVPSLFCPDQTSEGGELSAAALAIPLCGVVHSGAFVALERL